MPGAIETERQKRLWYTEAYLEKVLSRQALKRMILPEEVARLGSLSRRRRQRGNYQSVPCNRWRWCSVAPVVRKCKFVP